MKDRWYPVAALRDLSERHVFHTRLLDEELALWCDDAGGLNAWANRCPHRGVRLSIGRHCGATLQCRYHGFEFASGDGSCIRVPAHPADPAPARIRTTSFAVRHAAALVWVSLESPGALPIDATLRAEPIRAVSIHAPAEAVQVALAALSNEADSPLYFLQPATSERTIVHGLLAGAIDDATLIARLRRHDAGLRALRDRLEAFGHGTSRNPFWRIERA